MKEVIEASHAVALGAKLSKPKVIPVYPITPQTHIPEKIAEFVNNGELNAKITYVESEHSAASAMIGSLAVGVRTYSATSSQGLALMYEILPILSGMRLPAVMAVANRALSAPINIWNDHSDSVSARDQGWIQLYVESAQEALDTTIQAFRISETRKVLLPSMVCLDGFTLSHVFEPVEVPSQKKVDLFLPAFKPLHILNPAKPKTFGPIAFPNSFMEFKKMTEEAMQESITVIKKANTDFRRMFGRSYGDGMIEPYRMNDAKYAVMLMGSACGTARVVIDKLREKGKKVGMIKLRCLRPFPKNELIKLTKKLVAIGVIDRHISLGYEGPLFTDVRSALYKAKNKPELIGFIAGLGGRDIQLKHIERVFENLEKGRKGEWLL